MLAKVSKIATSVMLGTLLAGATGTAMAADNKTVLTLVASRETAWVKNFSLPANGSAPHHPSLHL